MEEVLIKSHLIVKDVHEEYSIHWIGKILDCKPKFKNGKPLFAIVGGKGRMELATTNMPALEKCAKNLTYPRGRSAVTTDMSRIYIIEENGNEKLVGIVTHNHVKTFAPMYDKVGWR